MSSRRKFLKAAGLGVAAWPVAHIAGLQGTAAWPGGRLPLDTLQLGIAGYTFLHVPMDSAIAMMKRVGVSNLSIKDFFLPLDSPQDRIHSVVAQFKEAGIRIYAAGVIYMKSEADVDRAFGYARDLGIDLIIGAPNPELLPAVDKKVKATGIRMAIHNHGPEDKLYPSPVDVYNHIQGLDERIGLCLDIGHASRAGADPAKIVRAYGSRIFDLHIKDLKAISRQAQPIELGRGVIDIPGLIRALVDIKFSGVCSIEHEMDMTDPLPGIAESAGFFRGVVRTL